MNPYRHPVPITRYPSRGISLAELVALGCVRLLVIAAMAVSFVTAAYYLAKLTH